MLPDSSAVIFYIASVTLPKLVISSSVMWCRWCRRFYVTLYVVNILHSHTFDSGFLVVFLLSVMDEKTFNVWSYGFVILKMITVISHTICPHTQLLHHPLLPLVSPSKASPHPAGSQTIRPCWEQGPPAHHPPLPARPGRGPWESCSDEVTGQCFYPVDHDRWSTTF